ncbi:MAG: peptide chain release factor N(5)-glutamine methyltransferase [Candidatus Buchananbacteria bacterium]|nr:peptide chain release factor N(5)-glutamine methyltransferase [Candidatus Buchananbacteria bacterium]
MTIASALARAMNTINSSSASLDAEVLLSFVLKKPKEFFYTYPEKLLTKAQEKKFDQLIKRRIKHEPIAYITGEKEWFGLDFFVNRDVLIPRPETELLAEEAINLVKKRSVTIADIGTGSGCISIVLAKQLPNAKIYATDISAKALTIAKKNNRRHQTDIKFFKGNLLLPLKNKKIDIIVSNLPYGSTKIWKNLSVQQQKGLSYEPKIALYTTNSGLTKYEELFKQVKKYHVKPKTIIIEIDPTQSRLITQIIRRQFPKAKIDIKKDLAKLDRIVIVTIA